MMEFLPLLLFMPVPLKPRHDGWTPDLQRRFILALASGLGPAAAARSVGKNRPTAYALRKRPGAESFAVAWDEALKLGRQARLGRNAQAPAAPLQQNDETDKSDTNRENPMPLHNFLNLNRPTVALRPARLRRRPC
jgi:hypothetical protein